MADLELLDTFSIEVVASLNFGAGGTLQQRGLPAAPGRARGTLLVLPRGGAQGSPMGQPQGQGLAGWGATTTWAEQKVGSENSSAPKWQHFMF